VSRSGESQGDQLRRNQWNGDAEKGCRAGGGKSAIKAANRLLWERKDRLRRVRREDKNVEDLIGGKERAKLHILFVTMGGCVPRLDSHDEKEKGLVVAREALWVKRSQKGTKGVWEKPVNNSKKDAKKEKNKGAPETQRGLSKNRVLGWVLCRREGSGKGVKLRKIKGGSRKKETPKQTQELKGTDELGGGGKTMTISV